MRNGFQEATDILGVKVSTIDYAETLSAISSIISSKKRDYICVCNVHMIMECQKDERLLKGINKAILVVPDGMPLVWLSRFHGHKLKDRVYGPTLMKMLCELSTEKKWKIFLLGGLARTTERLKKKLEIYYPHIKVVGNVDTPNRPLGNRENKNVIKIINKAKPDIVLVGIGCPFQEKWIIENIKYLETHIVIGVGAAFDFITGRVKQAPVWIQKLGLEWLFRLFQDPRRLWKRYVVTNPAFIFKLLQTTLIKIIS